MKNKLTLIIALFITYFIAQPAKAQMYDKGDISVNAGISFGAIGFGGYGGRFGGYSGFLPLSANVEYSINDKFAVGPYLGFYSRSYKNYDYRFTALAFGARGTFHATDVINDVLDANIDAEKIDIYGSALLGLENFSSKWDDRLFGNDYNDNYTKARFGLVAGVRYMFTPNIGGFFELGRGALGYSTLGITFKL
jgi:hypothetical protein